MNVLPFISAFFVSASVAATHSCDFFNNNDVHIGDATTSKHIRLIKFSPEKLKQFIFRPFGAVEKDYSKGLKSFVSSAGAVDLGMNGVPVLDQGQYGTCVTFSSTAALDARLGKSDFISQQCSLALDQGPDYNSSYWDGANYPSQIIDPLKARGVVSQSRCPVQYADPSESLSAQDYEALADKEASALVAQIQYVYSPKANLETLKASLRAGHRVLMAFTVDGSNQEAVQGFNAVVDGVAHTGGIWACQQPKSVNHCKASNAGHEVLVIGYDDAQQLLKIRNSWSDQFGDNGDWYMSYKFFSTMAVDQTVVY